VEVLILFLLGVLSDGFGSMVVAESFLFLYIIFPKFFLSVTDGDGSNIVFCR